MTNNLTLEQIEHMVDRFLRWKLPENFRPDAGISFKPDFNENTPRPNKHKPSGTNLFDCNQATEMVKFMIEDLPALPNQVVISREDAELIAARPSKANIEEYVEALARLRAKLEGK